MRPDGPYFVKGWDVDFQRWTLHSDHDTLRGAADAYRSAAAGTWYRWVALLAVRGGAACLLATTARPLTNPAVFRPRRLLHPERAGVRGEGRGA
jgi:hypothetical protein